jgi:spermidine synthase
MAIVWQQKKRGTLYQVRSAGKSLRLYTNGVLHSQYNPDTPVTGQAWDLLLLPAFFYPENTIQRVLVLGVGGGTVIHQLNHFIHPAEIVGVEMSKLHLSIGRRFFGLKNKNIKLVNTDAVSWLSSYQGQPFDMIIDDLFTEENGEPVSVMPANSGWIALMLKHLGKNGVIVKNFIDKQVLLQSAPLVRKSTMNHFKSIFQFNNDFNENFIAAFLRRPADSGYLRKRLKATPGLNPGLKTARLRYQVRKLAG